MLKFSQSFESDTSIKQEQQSIYIFFTQIVKQLDNLEEKTSIRQ